VTITGVKDISIGGTYVPVYNSYLKADAMEMGGAVSTPIESGEVTVTASVSVAYLCR